MTTTEKIELAGVSVQMWVSPLNGGITVQIDTDGTAPGQTVNVDLNEGRLYTGDPETDEYEPEKATRPEFYIAVIRDDAGSITDVRLSCPVPDCKSNDLAAVERDEAWRPVRIHEVYDGQVDVTIGDNGDTEPEGDGYVCNACRTYLTAPEVFSTFNIEYA